MSDIDPLQWLDAATARHFFRLTEEQLFRSEVERIRDEPRLLRYSYGGLETATGRSPKITHLTLRSLRLYTSQKAGIDSVRLLSGWVRRGLIPRDEHATRPPYPIKAVDRLLQEAAELQSDGTLTVDGLQYETRPCAARRAGVTYKSIRDWTNKPCPLLGEKLRSKRILVRQPHHRRKNYLTEITVVESDHLNELIRRLAEGDDDRQTSREIAKATRTPVETVKYRLKAWDIEAKSITRLQAGHRQTFHGYSYREYKAADNARRAAALAKLGITDQPELANNAPPRPGPKPTSDAIGKFCYEKLKAGVKRARIPGLIAIEFGEDARPKNESQVSTYAKRYAERHGLAWPIKRRR